MRPPDESRPLFLPLLILAAFSIGLAIHLQNGEYTPAAIGLVTVAVISLAVSVSNVGRALPAANIIGGQCPPYVSLIAVLAQIALLLLSNPSIDLPSHSAHDLLPFRIGLAIGAMLTVCLLIRIASLRRVIFFGLLLCVLALGVWMIHSSSHPHIDVWMFQQGASAELLHGHNPYAMTFPDIYHSTLPGYPQQVYGPGLVVNDRLQFGFPYPPVSLLMALPGYLIADDHRYAQLVALVLAGVLIAGSGKQPLAMLAAALLLFTPRVFFVIGRGWTEPFAVLLLALTVFFAVRKSRWLPIALGLFLATKQYLLIAVPLTFFLLPAGWTWRDWAKLLSIACGVALVVTLPFVFWNLHAFWKSTVTVQAIAPFRWDALSYIVWWGFHGHGEQVKQPGYALLPCIVAALIALALSLWRSPRTPGGFAASLALISVVFFAFNKQAFCNYYFFVIGAVCCAIAAGAGAHKPSFGSAEYVSAGSNPSQGSELGVRNRSA